MTFQLKQSSTGFTLIELMIVIAIIAILTSIAYPSYQDSVRKSRRAAAQADLIELSSFMERFFTENNKYHQNNAATPVAVSPPFVNTAFYTYSLPAKTATSFTLRATPTGAQTSDDCGTMSLSQTGQRITTGTAGCW